MDEALKKLDELGFLYPNMSTAYIQVYSDYSGEVIDDREDVILYSTALKGYILN